MNGRIQNTKMGLIKKHDHESGFFEDNLLSSEARRQPEATRKYGQHYHQTNGKHQMLRESALSKFNAEKEVADRKNSSSSSENNYHSGEKSAQVNNQHENSTDPSSKHSRKYYQMLDKINTFEGGTIVIDDDDDDDDCDKNSSDARRNRDTGEAEAISIEDDEDEFTSNQLDDSGDLNESFEVVESGNHIEDISDDDEPIKTSSNRKEDNKKKVSSAVSASKKGVEKSRTDSTTASQQLIAEIEEASTIRPQGKFNFFQ